MARLAPVLVLLMGLPSLTLGHPTRGAATTWLRSQWAGKPQDRCPCILIKNFCFTLLCFSNICLLYCGSRGGYLVEITSEEEQVRGSTTKVFGLGQNSCWNLKLFPRVQGLIVQSDSLWLLLLDRTEWHCRGGRLGVAELLWGGKLHSTQTRARSSPTMVTRAGTVPSWWVAMCRPKRLFWISLSVQIRTPTTSSGMTATAT